MEWRKGSQLEGTERLQQREARKEEKGRRKGGKCDNRVCWTCGKTGHIAANCTKGSWNRSLDAADEDKGDISEEVHEDEDELHGVVFAGGKRERAMARSHQQEIKIEVDGRC